MEFALSIALIVGIVLFVLGFFIVVWAGFKHHFITGLIALIPALNFIILPSVWHRAYIGFYLSVIGALITLGAWYGGGERYISTQAAQFGITLPFATISQELDDVISDTPAQEMEAKSEKNDQPESQGKSETAKIKTETVVEKAPFIPSGDLSALPQQALYVLVFETVDIEQMASLSGEQVRIEQKDGHIIEGKVTKANQDSLFVGHDANSVNVAFEIKADTISKLEKLVKRDN